MAILTVFTGGTIGSSRSDSVIAPDKGNASLLLTAYREQYGAAAFEVAAPYTILSENLSAAHLKTLRRCVEEHLHRGYEGIIITHGTDTLQYTAAYLDDVCGSCDVPVVLVSANYPLRDSRSNGLRNFAAAVDFIRTGEKGVFVAYYNADEEYPAIHRGRDVLPHQPFDDRVYSLFGTPYGTVQDGVFVKNNAYAEREREDLSACELNGRVLLLRPYVGMWYPENADGFKAVLLEGWHSGTLPTADENLRRFCEAAHANGVPVYLTGSVEGFEYASKQAFDDLHIQVLPPMSPIAAYMRLWLG